MVERGSETVTSWLEQIGMAHFAPAFADNGIDMDLLQELHDEDLKELGVVRLADRKRIFKEIRLLSIDRARGTIQRRLLSVFFCDMVGSTARSVAVDPEQFRNEMKLYQDTVVNAVNLHAGFVARFTGDGVLAYFGWPVANEDQASQAVRAGFEAIRALARLKQQENLTIHCRIGIATGRVVVGGQQDLDSAFGMTPNLAARLQSLAETSQIVIDSATRRAIGDRFETQFLASAELKGFENPEKAWIVLREHEYLGRLESRGGSRSRFVGREPELQILREAWERTCSGSGSVILLQGDPGIGKSRLLRHFCNHCLPPDTRVMHFHCSPNHVNSAFYPVIQHFGRIAGIDQNTDSNSLKLEKLARALNPEVVRDPQALGLLAGLVSIGEFKQNSTAHLSSQERRSKTIEAMVRQALLRADGGPVVFVVEDIHWMDPSTRELLDSIIGRIQETALLILVTCRRNSTVTLVTSESTREILLSGIDRAGIASLARSMDTEGVLAATDIAHIVERVDGVPLFAEEMTLTAIEQGVDGDSFMLPESLESSLAARLDNMGDAKLMLQVASVIGRDFPFNACRALARVSESALLDAVATAISAGLLREEQARGDRVFRFTHALVQDVAYNGLLKMQRRELHRRLATTVLDETVRQRQPELIAYHLTNAGEPAMAIDYWQRAGSQAAEASANAEAIAHFQQGLRLIPELPESEQRDGLEFDLWVGMAMPLIVARGYTCDELQDCINSALAVSKRIKHTPRIYSLLYSQWGYQLTFGLMESSRHTAYQFARLAEQQGDADALYASYRMLGASHMCLGELDRARQELGKLIADYEPQRHASLASVYGVNLRVAGRCFLSEVLWLQGAPEDARQSAATALAEARAIEHLQSHAISLHFCGLVSFLLRDPEAVRDYTGQMLELATQHPVGAWPTLARAMLAWANLTADNFDACLDEIERGVGAATDLGVGMFVPFFYCRIAELLLERSRLQECEAYLDKAADLMARTGEIVFRGELLQLRAQLKLRGNERASAEALFREGLAHARELQARSVELRVATAFARYLLPARRAEASSLLEQVLEQFDHSVDCADLREARELLVADNPLRELG